MSIRQNVWNIARTVMVLTVMALLLFQFLDYVSYSSGEHWGAVTTETTHTAVPYFDRTKHDCTPRNTTFLKKPKPFVALASFHGSGNTWTRELLEGLTGIHTGSCYTDRMANLTGSKRCPLDGGVYSLKTHQPSSLITHEFCKPEAAKDTHFERAIFILRNPYDALIADRNRKEGGKVAVAEQSDFRSNERKRLVKIRIGRWSRLVMYWTKYFPKPYHLLVYESLQTNTLEELISVAGFLQINVTNQRVKCILSEKPKYKRTEKPTWLNKESLFDTELRQIVNNIIRKTLKDVTSIKLNISNYLFSKQHQYDKKIIQTIESYLLE